MARFIEDESVAAKRAATVQCTRSMKWRGGGGLKWALRKFTCHHRKQPPPSKTETTVTSAAGAASAVHA